MKKKRQQKITLSSEEYAKICLECPYRDCIASKPYGCERLKPYKQSEQFNEKG